MVRNLRIRCVVCLPECVPSWGVSSAALWVPCPASWAASNRTSAALAPRWSEPGRLRHTHTHTHRNIISSSNSHVWPKWPNKHSTHGATCETWHANVFTHLCVTWMCWDELTCQDGGYEVLLLSRCYTRGWWKENGMKNKNPHWILSFKSWKRETWLTTQWKRTVPFVLDVFKHIIAWNK